MNPVKSTLYNTFFYASVCHVCKKSGGETALKQCSGCRMIVYCSREHQQKHWPKHKDLCKAIQCLRATFPAELSVSQETPKKMKLLKEKVEQNLKRRCKRYEEQMFNYPRMCLVCYKISGELQGCPHCMTVWFCPQHKNNHDSDTCERLKLCFESDISFIQEPLVHQNITKAYKQVTSFETEFSNMKEFINLYIKGIQSETSPHMLEMKQSARLTRPLTVFYGMQILNYMHEKRKPELVLHVIAADVYELTTLPEWEILLHIFPTVKCVKLVLIGPLKQIEEKSLKVCDICKRNKKSFSIEWQKTVYKHYVKRCSTFRQPNLVILFDNHSFNYDKHLQYIWTSSLKYIARFNCPFLLSYSKENNILDKKINKVLGSTIEFRNYKNPFACLKPHREYNEDSGYYVYYENAYLTVYKTLCP